MRQNLLKAGRELLSYPIREIVLVGKHIQKINQQQMAWENIGDPIAAGENVPTWVKEIIQTKLTQNEVFSYTDSKGDLKAREYVLKNFSNPKICSIENIIFFNGLGEAINKIFNNLPKESRVLIPSPTYPSHATAEAIHAGCSFLCYQLNPNNNWQPDIEDIENRVKYNDHIVAILVINPNNPTGCVHALEYLEKIVAIAKKYNCFLIFDEIYHHMVFNGVENTFLHQIIGEVPGLSLKGISKDVPWPGSRCGWIEVYNIDKDEDFKSYINIIMVTKMLEVCSTTLPQKVLPEIFANPQFRQYLQTRIDKYQKRADEAFKAFSALPNIRVNKPQGVFYIMVELLNLPKSHLKFDNQKVRQYLDQIETSDINNDFQFAYELMAAEMVCVVPLTGFGSKLTGFRMTLLQEDDAIFTQILAKISNAIKQYYANC